MEKFKQNQQADTASKTFSVKVNDWAWHFLNAIAESREHGTNGNDLLKKCLQFVIETAKIDGPVPPQFQTLVDMLRLDVGWQGNFNFADPAARMDVAQVVLILQQHDSNGPRKGLGLVMIDKPFFGESKMTLCLDDILERIIEIATPGNFRRLKWMSEHLETDSIREAITILADNTITETKEREFMAELPGYDNRADNGRPVVFGQRTKRKMHYDIANMPSFFDNWEGEMKQMELPTDNIEDVLTNEPN